MEKIYYEKRGNRYHPVSEYDPDVMDSFPRGSHLVSVREGSNSRRYNIDPAFAPMIAAGLYAEDAICRALSKASEMRPARVPLTERQQKAWRELADSFGDELCTLNGASSFEIADAAVKAMITEANKLMTKEPVRKAYEQFLMVCELSKDRENE
jgi:hypothetical protein